MYIGDCLCLGGALYMAGMVGEFQHGVTATVAGLRLRV